MEGKKNPFTAQLSPVLLSLKGRSEYNSHPPEERTLFWEAQCLGVGGRQMSVCHSTCVLKLFLLVQCLLHIRQYFPRRRGTNCIQLKEETAQVSELPRNQEAALATQGHVCTRPAK